MRCPSPASASAPARNHRPSLLHHRWSTGRPDGIVRGGLAPPRRRAARLPPDLLQRSHILLTQAGNFGGDADGTLLEEYGQEDARGQIRPGQGRVALVLVV